MTTLELEPLVEEVNLYLNRHQKIHKDDPILANMIINKIILEKYVESLKQSLRESQHEIDAKTQQELEKATDRAAKMIANTGNVLEKQLVNAGLAWEQKFKESAAMELAKVEAASQVAKFGGYCLMAAGVFALAYELIQLVARLTGQHP
jgi:hypothetical protein